MDIRVAIKNYLNYLVYIALSENKYFIFQMTKLIFTSFLLFPFFIFAEEKTSIDGPPEENLPKIIKNPIDPDAIIEGSSEHKRIGKKYEVDALLLGGGSYYAAYSYGISIGKFLNYKSQILFEAFSQTTATNSSLFGVHYKRFFSNSFYTQIGLDQTTYTYTTNGNYYWSIYNGLNANFTANITNVVITIGNQWNWDNFTIGCSWIGFNQPLITSVTNESFSGNTTIANINNFRSTEEDYIKKATAQLLRFYIGYAF